MTNLLIRLFIKDYKNTDSLRVRQKYGTLGGAVGIFCNICLFIGKLLAGIFTRSIAITADAVNNISDAGSSVITLVGFKMAGKPANEKHPFGHGRIEYLSGFVVSVVIMMMGVELIKSSIEQIFSPEPIVFHWASFIVLLVSIAVKLWMCLFNRSIAKRIDSAAIKATSMDSLSDAVATSAVAVSILISHFTGWYIDGYVGVLVALFIIYTGISTAKDTFDLLLGEAPDPKLVKEIEHTVLSYEEINGIHDLIIHNYGPGRIMISMHAEISSSIDVMRAHDIVDFAENELKETFHCDAVIHMDPIATDDVEINAMKEKVSRIIREIDPKLSFHDFRMTQGPMRTNLIFDVVVPYQASMKDEEIEQRIKEAVHELDQSYFAVIHIDKSFVV